MQFNQETGLLTDVRFIPSPNFNERPLDSEIDMIVIHNISLPPGEFGGSFIEAFFTNTLDSTLHPYFAEISPLNVSTHCLINREGKITQFVPFHKRAWHAGESSFKDRSDCNNFSIGIELEGSDEIPYTEAQYVVLEHLIRLIRTIYPKITRDRIVGHSTIAPQRKTDPGASFNWNFLKNLE